MPAQCSKPSDAEKVHRLGQNRGKASKKHRATHQSEAAFQVLNAFEGNPPPRTQKQRLKSGPKVAGLRTQPRPTLLGSTFLSTSAHLGGRCVENCASKRLRKVLLFCMCRALMFKHQEEDRVTSEGYMHPKGVSLGFEPPRCNLQTSDVG